MVMRFSKKLSREKRYRLRCQMEVLKLYFKFMDDHNIKSKVFGQEWQDKVMSSLPIRASKVQD